MWRCVKCMEYNNDSAGSCAKCQAGRPTFDPDETSLDGLVDLEKPVPVSEASTVQCPTCGETFKVAAQHGGTSRISRAIDNAMCPSCARPITPETLVKVRAAARESGKVKEVILACPYCGKIVGVVSE